MTETRPLRDLGERPVWVRAEGICMRVGPLQVLQEVDGCFRPGRVTAVLGPNGAGKTTLLKMILGLVRPDEGTVPLGETKVNGEAEYRRDIGYMPQLPRFPENLTGWELTAMLDDLRDFQGPGDETLLDAFDLRGEMDKPFRTLSGGNRQKLNASLALRYGARVLVLDEPTAGLDPVAARVLKKRVRAERDRGCTVLLTSHELGQLEAMADDVVFLLEGRVRFEGELAEILTSTGHEDLEGAIASLILEGVA
ncbi:MAG: ABC transporter ATP-binding protein [Gemmatimonadetes bacterium]|nr:ABC transporter ATP-binding protein [Gemmatimonadota bacterium]